MTEESDNPLKKVAKNINESVVNVADALGSLPNAAARHIVDKIHGEGAAEKVAGKFDDKPVTSFVATLRGRNHSNLER